MLYGARSGIQKAVRRGDLSLGKTCFELLWSDKEQQQWFLWRIPVLVFEDCWIMAGELAKAQEGAANLDGESLRNHWLQFYLQLVIAVKNQDAGWMWYLTVHGKKDYSSVPEFAHMKRIVDELPCDTPEALQPSELSRRLKDIKGEMRHTDYEARAIESVEGRRMEGRISDRWNSIAAQVIITMRGLPEEGVLCMLEEQKAAFADAPARTLDALPWYCYDMHTQPGRLALKVFQKHYATPFLCDEDHIDTAWFQFTSARLGEKVRPVFSEVVGTPTWDTSMWQLPKEEAIADWYGIPLQVLQEHWQTWEPKMQDLVEWAVKKSQG
jgi:hypothetical protein